MDASRPKAARSPSPNPPRHDAGTSDRSRRPLLQHAGAAQIPEDRKRPNTRIATKPSSASRCARPDVAFKLAHNGRAHGTCRRTVAKSGSPRVLGDDFGASALPVDVQSAATAADAARRVAGRGARHARRAVSSSSTAASCATRCSRTRCARPTRTCCTTTAIRRSCCSSSSIPRAWTSTCTRPRAKCASAIRGRYTSSCSMRVSRALAGTAGGRRRDRCPGTSACAPRRAARLRRDPASHAARRSAQPDGVLRDAVRPQARVDDARRRDAGMRRRRDEAPNSASGLSRWRSCTASTSSRRTRRAW